MGGLKGCSVLFEVGCQVSQYDLELLMVLPLLPHSWMKVVPAGSSCTEPQSVAWPGILSASMDVTVRIKAGAG